MRDVLTPDEVADELRLSRGSVYRLIRGHRLAAIRIGRSYRIPRRDLDSFLFANSTRPAVRQALFERINAIAERNPDVDGDRLLEDLEREDDERKRKPAL